MIELIVLVAIGAVIFGDKPTKRHHEDYSASSPWLTIEGEMRRKDSALYESLSGVPFHLAVDIWVQTYPEDFPNRELKIVP